MPTNIGRISSPEDYILRPPACLRTFSVASIGPWESELVAALTQRVRREDIAYLLFVDSFFLPDLLSLVEHSLDLCDNVKGISVDKTSEDSHFVFLLDAFPSLVFLCITVRMDWSYYALPEPRRFDTFRWRFSFLPNKL
ncbi:hypothetical protein AURDEDRAFT_159515 [Auricularia subglabra TFB-10046 SS5]|nr:hypothetical protein AURDEDRAFT_159515 [Auricularia subglabra TFB-10046 SS5]